jgi:sirohydrochlorin ferrochelatase
MPHTGVIVLAHGSRGERGKSEVPEVLNRITQGLRSLLSPDVEIIGAALQFNKPDLEEAVRLQVEHGAQQVIIAPYFLFTGRHLTQLRQHEVKIR